MSNRYPSYKPSGVEWIGETPAHWEIRKLSRSYHRISSGTTPSADKNEYYQDGTINWINTGDLNDSVLLYCNKRVTEKALMDHSALKVYQVGSIVMAMYGATIGKLSLLGITGCTNQACCVLTQSSYFNNSYLFYWLMAHRQNIISLSYGGGQPNISQELIRSLRVTCPPLYEQEKMVTYLDEKTSLIDETIRKKQQLIELLQEERTAIINQAVNRGLNPDVKLKPSDTELLDEIPRHWEVKKLGLIADITRLAGYEYTEYWEPTENGEIVALRGFNIGFNELQKLDTVERISESLSQRLIRSRLFVNDIVYPCVGTIGKAYLVKENDKYHINQNIAKITPNEHIDPLFLLYFLISDRCMYQVYYFNTSDAQPSVLVGNLRRFKIPVPPLTEQKEIASHIEKSLQRIDVTIATVKKEAGLLQEYRTALINEVVTGQGCVVSMDEEVLA